MESEITHYQMENGNCDPNEYGHLVFHQSHSHWVSEVMITSDSEAQWCLKHNDFSININKWQTDNSNMVCHGSWIKHQTTSEGIGFEPVSQCKSIQIVIDKENGNINMSKSSVTHAIEAEISSLSCNTNKVICHNRHIALKIQVSTATLDLHMVNSSGYKNDQVFCTNNDASINTWLQRHNDIENVYLINELINESDVYNFSQLSQCEKTGTRQSHDSTCIQIDKLQSFSQILLENFILFNESLDNSLVNRDSTTKEALFSETLVNESTWLLNTQAQRECRLVHSRCDHKVVGGTRIERQYGFIPYTIPKLDNLEVGETIPFESTATWLNKITNKVRSYQLPNYKGARIPLVSDLKVHNWRYLMKNYDYKVLAEYIQFGFPLAIDYAKFSYNDNVSNHFSARCREKGVDGYFEVQTSKNAILGPFDKNPFHEMHFSPLMARDKPDGKVRVIVGPILAYRPECE